MERVEKPLHEDEINLDNKYSIDISLSPFILSLNEAVYFYPIYLDMIDYSINILGYFCKKNDRRKNIWISLRLKTQDLFLKR